MPEIKDIEVLIRRLIETNEKIVTKYDSKFLCSDYEKTKEELKKLVEDKKEITESLEKSFNEFFTVKQNFFTKHFLKSSFKLDSTIIGFEYKFSLPSGVDKTSRQYFCYITMMDKLTRQYDSLSKMKEDYYILDITSGLNLKDLLK